MGAIVSDINETRMKPLLVLVCAVAAAALLLYNAPNIISSARGWDSEAKQDFVSHLESESTFEKAYFDACEKLTYAGVPGRRCAERGMPIITDCDDALKLIRKQQRLPAEFGDLRKLRHACEQMGEPLAEDPK